MDAAFSIPHPLTCFEVQLYYQKELQANGVYVRNFLHNSKFKYGAYIINTADGISIGTYWITFYVNGNHSHNNKLSDVEASIDTTYLDSFGVEHISREIKRIIDNKITKAITY